MRFSVVIPVLDDSPGLGLVFHALAHQTIGRHQFECILPCRHKAHVADALDANRDLDARVIEGALLGIGQAWDRALAESRGEVVVFLDPRMIPAPTWLQAFEATLASSQDLDVISGGRYHVIASPDSTLGQRMFSAATGPELAEEFASLAERAQLGQRPGPVYGALEEQLRAVVASSPTSLVCAYSLLGCNVAIRRRALSLSTGFNSCLMNNADTELGVRLWEVGSRFGFSEEAKACALTDGSVVAKWSSYEDVRMLFYRHPYTAILLAEIWAAFRGAGRPLPLDGYQSLESLAKVATSPDFDVVTLFEAAFGKPLPFHGQLERHELIKSLSGFRCSPEASIRGLVSMAVDRGVFSTRSAGKTMLGLPATDDWIAEHAPYDGPDHWPGLAHAAPLDIVDNRTKHQLSRNPDDLIILRCSGALTVTFEPEALEGRSATISLPLPMTHQRQSGVRIFDIDPPELESYLLQDAGCIFEAPIGGWSRRTSYSYKFEMNLTECAAVPLRRPAEAPRDPELLKHAFPGKALERARCVLEQVGGAELADSPFERARRIYSWIQSNVTLTTLPIAFYKVLSSGFGDCRAQCGLMVQLLRLAGIPARIQSGGLFHDRFDREQSGGRVELRWADRTALTHAWVEFFSSNHGWVAAEIQAYGKRRISATAIPDPNMRESIRTKIEGWEGERFGDLSLLRLYTTDKASGLPPHPVVTDATREQRQRLVSSTSTSFYFDYDVMPLSRLD